MVTAERVVVVRDAGSNNECCAGKVQSITSHGVSKLGISYHKHAANETSVVRDLQRLSTAWSVVVSEPGFSLSGKGRANVNATTELSCARDPRAPRAAS